MPTSRSFAFLFLFVCLFIGAAGAWGQETSSAYAPFDHQFFFGNRITWGNSSGQWRYSGELQFRVANDYQALERWYVEGVASYLLNKNWELVPDVRISVLPSRVEFRPGLGVLYKLYPFSRLQMTTQLKYQLDLSRESAYQGVRAVLFANYLINGKFIPSFLFGPFWTIRSGGEYSGIQAYRIGAGCGFIIGNQHTLNLTYFIGNDYTKSPKFIGGALLVQLSINLRRDFKYLPGRVIIF